MVLYEYFFLSNFLSIKSLQNANSEIAIAIEHVVECCDESQHILIVYRGLSTQHTSGTMHLLHHSVRI